jgi:type VI secretion system protein ImpK
MRKEIADIVFPVIRKAIEIKEGLRTNERAWDFADAQKKLMALVQAPFPDQLRSDVVGDQRAIDASISTTRLGFLGIRYALACWLDEIFIGDSAWKEQWNASKVETHLFGINDRASEFWKQAQRAQSRPTRDALEVFYLCVMLGFRGELIENPTEIISWRESVEPQITQGEEREYRPPPGLTITPNVRALKGAAEMQRWIMIATIIGLLFIPLFIWFVANMK